MSRSARNPTNWDEYQYGTSHRSSISSAGGRSVHFDEHDRDESPSAGSSRQRGRERRSTEDNEPNLRRRRSSVAMRLSSLAHVGGVNSIENFARSWQRAAGFQHSMLNSRTPIVLSIDDEEDASPYGRILDAETARVGLLRSQLEQAQQAYEGAIEDTEAVLEGGTLAHSSDHDHADKHLLAVEPGSLRSRRSHSIFTIAPHLATPLVGSYGTSYGTLPPTLEAPSMAEAGRLWREQQEAEIVKAFGGVEPVKVKKVEINGEDYYQRVGESTIYQTILNSTNVLIGVGLLSLPLAIKYSGWICGMTFLLFAALATQYTAGLLAKCMDNDIQALNFASIAQMAFGPKAKIAVAVLFVVELTAACVALIILFADTLHLLYPDISRNEYKIFSALILIPLNYAPLSILSITSFGGILSCFSIVAMLFIDGLMKPHAPGSLRDPATTYLFPANWLTLPLSFGLLMSPWGGHGVFPDLYKDMRHPRRYPTALKAVFSFTYLLDTATAVAGILMFGDDVMDEITGNLLSTTQYGEFSRYFVCFCITIIPLTKLPLNTRPIITIFEEFLGLDARVISDSPSLVGMTAWTRGLLKLILRVGLAVIFVLIALVLPSFDSIMGFMGSALCNLVCIILPCAFHLKIFGHEIKTQERILNYFLICFASILAVIGTVVGFLPPKMLGIE